MELTITVKQHLTSLNMDEIKDLQRQIDELTRKLDNQPLNSPLDSVSRTAVQANLPVFKDFTSGSVATGGSMRVEINGIEFKLLTV